MDEKQYKAKIERELGLTASALKKINEQGLRVKKTSSLAEVLKDLDGD